MLQIYTVNFFGHRYVDNMLWVEERLEEIIKDLMRKYEYVDFLVGRSGDFDQLVSSTVRRCKKNFWDANSSLSLVLP